MDMRYTVLKGKLQDPEVMLRTNAENLLLENSCGLIFKYIPGLISSKSDLV